MNSEGSAGAISEEDDISGWNVENGAFSAQQMEIDDNLGRNGNKDRISAPEGQQQEDGNFSGCNGKMMRFLPFTPSSRSWNQLRRGRLRRLRMLQFWPGHTLPKGERK